MKLITFAAALLIADQDAIDGASAADGFKRRGPTWRRTLVGLASAVRVEASYAPTNWAQLRACHHTLPKPRPTPRQGTKRD